MTKVFDTKTQAGSEKQNEPHLIGDILQEYFSTSEPLAIAYRESKMNDCKIIKSTQVWNPCQNR